MRIIASIAAVALLYACSSKSDETHADKPVPSASIAKKDDPPDPKPVPACRAACMAPAKNVYVACKKKAEQVGADPWRCQVALEQAQASCNLDCGL